MTKKELLKNEYRKQRKRILGYLSDMRRRGYDTSGVSVPAIPKRITEGSIRRLDKLRPNVLRKDIVYVSLLSGELIPAANRREVHNARVEDNAIFDGIVTTGPYYSDSKDNQFSNEEIRDIVIIQNFIDELKNINNETAYIYIYAWLRSWIGSMGSEFVAHALEDAANSGIRVTVTEGDSYNTAKQKSMNFIEKIMVSSGEYTREGAGDLIADLDMMVD